MLSEGNIAESYFIEGFDLSQDLGLVFEESDSFFHGHVKHVTNGFPFESDFQRFTIVAFAFAGFTGNIHIWQKFHFDQSEARALASFAATALDVERKPSSLVATNFGF